MAKRKIEVEIVGDADKLRRAFKSSEKDAASFKATITSVSSGVGALGGGFGALTGSILASTPAMVALAGATVAVGAALAPLVGLAAAGGVGLSALAQGAGVLALATAGVGDALKEQVKAHASAGASATKNADQQRNAARAIKSAEDGLADAQRNAKQAQTALNEARVQARSDIAELADAVDAAKDSETDAAHGLKEAERSVTDAQRNAEDAQTSLTQARADAAANIAELQRAVTDAAHAEAAAERELEDAQDRVTDTVSASADAQRDLTQARVDAQRQIDDLTESVDDSGRAEERANLRLQKAREDLEKVNADPKATARDRAEAALDVADAEDAVSDAHRDHEDAVKASTEADAKGVEGSDKVTTALSNVEKAAKAEKTAQQGVADAQWDLTKAREAQVTAINASNDATAKGIEGSAGVITANRDIAKAVQGVADAVYTEGKAQDDLADSVAGTAKAQKEYTDAKTKGVAGSAGVIAAAETLAEANRAVKRATDSVKDAQLDAAAATTAMGATLANANEKFDALPPAAQDFVTTLIKLKPKLDDLRQTAAAGLFPGVVDGINAAARNFGPLKKVVGETSGVLGDLARKAGELIGSSGFGKDIETVGHRNAIIIDRVGGAALHLVSAFRHVVVAAGPLTTWLAKVFEGWAKGVDDAAEAGRKSGDLADFFQKTRNTLIRVVSIVKNLGEAFFNVGKAAAPFGRDILASIDKVTGGLADWTKSSEGQKALIDFFKQSKGLADKLMPVLANVAGSLGGLALRTMPVYVSILEKLGPLAGPIVVGFVAYKIALTGVTVATNLARAAQVLWTGVTKVAAAAQWLFRDALIVTRVQLAALWVQTKLTAVATGIMTGAQWLLNAALTANPIGLIVIGIAALVAGLIIAYKKSETFRAIVTGAFNAVKDAASAALGWVSDNWPKVLEVMTAPFAPFIALVTRFGPDIIAGLKAGLSALAGVFTGPLTDAWNAVLDFFGVHSPSTLFAELGGNLVAGLVNGLKAAFQALADAAKWVGDQIVAGVKAYVEIYKDVGKWVINRFVDGVKLMASAVADAAGWLKNRVVEGVNAYVETFKSLGGTVLGWFVAGFKAVTDGIVGVGGWIKNRISDGIELIADAFKGLGANPIKWIVEGVKSYVELTTGVGGWLKNRVDEGLTTVKDGFIDLGGTIMGWIVSGLKKGAFELQEFLNKIIHVINKLPGVNIGDIDVLKKDDKGNVTGFARGGAYAKTGGVVNSPIVMMGEEAPNHPEYVIPTNPAYRGRARGLLAQAAGAIGFAQGGINQYNHVFPSHYLDQPGFRMPPDDVMAIAQQAGLPGRPFEQIAHGESDYHPGVVQRDPGDGMVGYGMWQMTPNAWGDAGKQKMAQLGGVGQMLNPFKNAAMAKFLYDSGGISQWYGTKYLGQDGSEGGGVFGAVKGAVGKVGGIVGDLVSKGAGFILDKLPSADGLGWLKGTGEYILSKVTDWVKDKVTGIVGANSPSSGETTKGPKGIGTFEGLPMANWVIGAMQYARSKGFTGRPTSGYRTHADNVAHGRDYYSEHEGTQYPHGAVDFGGFTDGKAIKDAFVAAVADYKYPLLAPIGFRDDGHASGTGHANGGVVKARVGEFGPEDVYMPQGSRVVPNYMTQPGAGKDGITIDMRGAHIGSQRAARVMAERLAMRVQFG